MDKKPEKLVPEVRFKGFTDDWEQHKFDNVVKRINDKDDNPELPHIEFENIISGNGTLNKNIKELNSKKIGTKFQKEDIIFGKLRPYLKNWYFAKENGIAVGDFWVLRAKRISVFVYYLIQTEKFYSIANLSSGSKMPRSDWNLVSNSRFNFPENTIESIKIGNLILQLDKLITLQQRKLEQLTQLKKAMLQQLFADKNSKQPNLRFKNFKGDWEQHKLKSVVSVNSGKDYKSLEKGNIPVYGTGGYITSVSKSLSNQDAIGLGRKGTINKPYILKAPFWTVDTLFYLTLKPENILTFIYSLIQKINWLKYDESTGLPSLSKKNIKNVLVSLTKLDEQQKIGKVIVKLDKFITLHQSKIDQLTILKKYLLQKLFI